MLEFCDRKKDECGLESIDFLLAQWMWKFFCEADSSGDLNTFLAGHLQPRQRVPN